jgi:hypothetical protein
MDKAVFVSFASADESPVRAVCDTLEREGISCWIARRDIDSGANWVRSIIEAIDNCKGVVLMLSAAANESIHVANEVSSALLASARSSTSCESKT